MTKKRWKPYEINYLYNNYQTQSVDDIAKRLKRTPRAIKHKAYQLGLNAYIGEFIYAKTLASCFHCDVSVIFRWIRIFDLKHTQIQRGQSTCYLITTHDFWNWANTHKDLIPWEKYEPYSLLPEPSWLKSTIKQYSVKNHRKRFTTHEKESIICMRNNGASWTDIAKQFNRTSESIKHVWRQRDTN